MSRLKSLKMQRKIIIKIKENSEVQSSMKRNYLKVYLVSKCRIKDDGKMGLTHGPDGYRRNTKECESYD